MVDGSPVLRPPLGSPIRLPPLVPDTATSVPDATASVGTIECSESRDQTGLFATINGTALGNGKQFMPVATATGVC